MRNLKSLIRPLVRELHPYVYGEQPKIRIYLACQNAPCQLDYSHEIKAHGRLSEVS
jgi:hypothetical protein